MYGVYDKRSELKKLKFIIKSILAINMLSPTLTKYFVHMTPFVMNFAALSVTVAFGAMLLARLFGGKSSIKRQTIFSIVSFIGICVAAYWVL